MGFDLTTLGTIHDANMGEVWDAVRLAEETRLRAKRYAKLGITPASIVAITHGGTPSFFADLFAVWRLQACAACLDPALSKPEMETVINFVGPDLILDGEKATKPEVRERQPGHETAALILFTSGTTGTPKGVVLSFEALAARIELNRRNIGESVLTNSLCVLPTHFGHGLIGNCLTPLLAGMSLFLSPGMGVREVAGLGHFIEKYGITFMSSVPAFWRIALKVSVPPKPGHLRRVHIGSAPLSADLWRAVVDWTGTGDVVNMYGITETANWIAGATASKFDPEDGLIGTPWGGEIMIRKEDGSMKRQGEGEIVLRSPSIMDGYFERPDETAAALQDGWFRTGDVGRIDARGVVRLTGRIKHEINRAGMKIHPEDIDLLLERHAEVAEACAFGIPDSISGEIVGIAVRTQEGSKVTVDGLRKWCRERLRREAVPERWFLVGEIPKTDRGKINRERVMKSCLNANG